MKTFYQILLPLTGLFFSRVELTDLIPLKLKITEYKVLDGDTIKGAGVLFKESIRLVPIDAPELSQQYLTRRGSAGEFSKQCLVKILSEGEVEVSWDKRDMYGRVLGSLWVNGENVAFRLVREGCAFLYPYARFKNKKEKGEWIRHQQYAQTHRKGIWKYGVLSPSAYRRQQKKNRKISKRI